MSEQEAPHKNRNVRQNGPPTPLFIDEWLRKDVINDSSNAKDSFHMQGMPTRRLIYYCTAVRLAATLERVRQHSLHYSRKFAENPGLEALNQAVSELKDAAALCLRSRAKSYGLIEEKLLGALKTLPFTRPEELAREPESFLAVSHSEIEGLISQNSSGTTGQLSGEFKRIFCTKNDQEKTMDFFANGIRYLVDPARRDRVALLLAAGGRCGGNLADLFGTAMRRIGVPCLVPENAADEAATLAELAEFAPTCAVGTPRQIISLFRSSEFGERIARIKSTLKNILLSGDRISSAVSQILGRELEADIFLHYGMVESGLGMAVECGRRNGCHYRETDFLVEIITPDGVSHPLPQNLRETVYVDPGDLDGGRIYSPTPWGEITITSLSRQASPLIRYRTGDSGRIIVDRCSCGSEVWRLEARGRIGDHVELPPVPGDSAVPQHIIHSSFDRALYSLPWVKDHQISIRTDANGKAGELGIAVLANGAAPADDAEASLVLAGALAPVEARASAHGVGIFIYLKRNREEFRKLFHYTPKRSFLCGTEPFDPALYTRMQGS